MISFFRLSYFTYQKREKSIKGKAYSRQVFNDTLRNPCHSSLLQAIAQLVWQRDFLQRNNGVCVLNKNKGLPSMQWGSLLVMLHSEKKISLNFLDAVNGLKKKKKKHW